MSTPPSEWVGDTDTNRRGRAGPRSALVRAWLRWMRYSLTGRVLLAAGYLAVVVAGMTGHEALTQVAVLLLGAVTLTLVIAPVPERRRVARPLPSLPDQDKLAALVRHGTDLLCIADAECTIRFASPSHEVTIGTPPQQLVGQTVFSRMHPEDAPRLEAEFAAMIRGETNAFNSTFRLRHADGSWRWIDGFATDLREESSIGAIVLNGRDVTERQVLEAQLLDQVLRDPLTGLANRRLFRDRVEHALRRHQRGAHRMAVLFLDLDHFKLVNDTLGHAAGDTLLTTVAGRITTALRDSDTIARLGGDEFAVLLEDMADLTDAEQAAQRIQQMLERPIVIDEREVYVRASIGIAHVHETHEVDDLLADADAAMYGAKQAGRGGIQHFSTAMRARARERMEIEGQLRHAIERDELFLVYQPVLDLGTGQITGVEALMRWEHPVQGSIPPARFIPVAEESDLIVEIGRIALRRAAQDAVRLRASSPRAADLQVAVNLSPRHLLLPDVVDDIRTALDAAHCPPHALVVELTETVLAANESVISDRLKLLRDLGVQIALDDFGTGYSSLAYLRRFPIDILKLDRSFLADHDADITADGITRAILSIGQSLQLRTTAEGVETDRQLRQLMRMGCTHAQGFVIARPGNPDDIAVLVEQWDGTDIHERLKAARLIVAA